MAKKTLALVPLLLVLAACASQPHPKEFSDAPGFFSGVFHGATFITAFLIGVFSDVRMYAFPNSGVWYDLGFIIGIPIQLGLVTILFVAPERKAIGVKLLIVLLPIAIVPLVVSSIVMGNMDVLFFAGGIFFLWAAFVASTDH